LLSLALWQTTSIEKLNASAKAAASQYDCLLIKAMNIITRQNKLTITVNAFFQKSTSSYNIVEFKQECGENTHIICLSKPDR
jgi:hypothetical protein